jgi:hypothetical protein
MLLLTSFLWRGIRPYIDLMLEDMGKIYWIKEIVDSTRSVTICVCMCVCVCSYIYEIFHIEQGVGSSRNHVFHHLLHFSPVSPQFYVGVVEDVSINRVECLWLQH